MKRVTSALLLLCCLAGCTTTPPSTAQPAPPETTPPRQANPTTTQPDGPPPSPEPVADGPCPYLESAFVGEANGQRATKVRISADKPHPTCFFYRSDGNIQLTARVYVGTAKVLDLHAPHRGIRRDARLSLLSRQTPSLARHSLAGLLCDVVWLSQL